MTTKSTLELIDRYLNQDLRGNELSEFEKMLSNNPWFRKEVNLHKEINAALLEKDIMKLRNELKSIQAKQRTSRNKIIRMFPPNRYLFGSIAAAASIILIIGGILLFSKGDHVSNNSLYSNYYNPEEAITIVRSGGNTEDITLKEAMMAYQDKNYESAIELFSQEPQNNLAKFYMGLSYMETGNSKKAIELFNELISHQENLFVEQAEWYLGLSYLKIDEYEKAKELLTRIANSDNIYQTDAKKILKNL
ncbi:MAG: tetratricopeptide repeat protein [Bacteroidales bacterium]|nr:tetratricopeptide repeat protein [Bacteroidales bacterium]MCF8344188.1 tetratricopeptide repeat protein [Bacteroidales bacterium]MCF8350523.1 tetratricopeptide repeat protein [Bacteroidales bacterium]MCF8375214.1 tetratricopeptide repeat protein [Bacteroidales bacterium]MCF8400238.1 tetratricopeptide repeat protein [Bacteroidales bacterium]